MAEFRKSEYGAFRKILTPEEIKDHVAKVLGGPVDSVTIKKAGMDTQRGVSPKENAYWFNFNIIEESWPPSPPGETPDPQERGEVFLKVTRYVTVRSSDLNPPSL